MDGDGAPLVELHRLTRAAGAWLMVDDAHGVGVRGEQGRGSCWQQGVRPELLVATFGKAFGVSGAAVLCDEGDRRVSAAVRPPSDLQHRDAAGAGLCAAGGAGLHSRGDELRARLQDNICRFRQGAAPLALTLTDSDTAIQPLLVGTINARGGPPARARAVESAIRPPAVPPGGARLRITLTAAHQPQDIDRLLEVLHDVSQ